MVVACVGEVVGDQESPSLVGAIEGENVGRVGLRVGRREGADEGEGHVKKKVGEVGLSVGDTVVCVGLLVGDQVAPSYVGPIVGPDVTTVGASVVYVGDQVCGWVGAALGANDGGVGNVGLLVGEKVSPALVGPIEGAVVLAVGVCVGALVVSVGALVGDVVGGARVGALVGEVVT